MGIYLKSIVEITEAKHCFLQAHECYKVSLAIFLSSLSCVLVARLIHIFFLNDLLPNTIAWGAFGKAEQIQRDHGLDLNNVNIDQITSKHERDWDGKIGSC